MTQCASPMSPRNGMIRIMGMPHAIQMLVRGHAATSKPEVGTNKAGTLPESHAPAHKPTPIASLLTETQRIVGSLKSCNCTLLNSESGSKETKFTPASLSPTMISETASSFIAITQPRTNTELDDFGFENTKIRIRISKSQI